MDPSRGWAVRVSSLNGIEYFWYVATPLVV